MVINFRRKSPQAHGQSSRIRFTGKEARQFIGFPSPVSFLQAQHQRGNAKFEK
jgi:hypothetical protein